jgi:dienelactone hydrolase
MNLLLALLALQSGDLTVLKPEEQPRKMLYAHLQAEAGQHFEARRQRVAALKTPEDVRRRQLELRAKFIDALGGFPEKTPLNARVVGDFKREGYRVEKVIYESRPDHHVTGNLYLPDGKGPFSAVLVPCGHSDNGKAAEAYQKACILMAKNGLAALCYDPIGQGERLQRLGADGKAAIKGSTNEHTVAGIGAMLVGGSCATYRIWDGIRSIDYLASRPEIDPKRLGCAGNSGGGTLTAYLMALDERIAAAAPSCYITTLERLFATIGPQDAEQNIPGQVAFGLEHTDYVTMRAPRATLINVGTQDYFDITGAWTTFREAKKIYGILGFGERVDLFEWDDKHGWSKPRRESAMRWMRRWLLEVDDAPVEGELVHEKDEILQCTKTGQVLSEFKGKSVFDLNLAREKELAARRPKLSTEEVGRLTAAGGPAPLTVVSQGTSERGDFKIHEVRGKVRDGFPVPALHFTSTQGTKGSVLYVHGEGKAKEAGRGGEIEDWVRQSGMAVVAIDARGFGETQPDRKSGGYGGDEQNAFLALHLNRPLLGQRVLDIRSWVGHMGKDLMLVGIGEAAPAALHAAVLEPGVAAVRIEGGLLSWASVVANPATKAPLSNVVPGALAVYDLPDLAAAIAPRPLTIRNPVDGAGKPVSQAELEAAYAGARAAYKAAGAEHSLKLEAAR